MNKNNKKSTLFKKQLKNGTSFFLYSSNTLVASPKLLGHARYASRRGEMTFPFRPARILSCCMPCNQKKKERKGKANKKGQHDESTRVKLKAEPEIYKPLLTPRIQSRAGIRTALLPAGDVSQTFLRSTRRRVADTPSDVFSMQATFCRNTDERAPPRHSTSRRSFLKLPIYRINRLKPTGSCLKVYKRFLSFFGEGFASRFVRVWATAEFHSLVSLTSLGNTGTSHKYPARTSGHRLVLLV